MDWRQNLNDREIALIRDCMRYSLGDAAGLPGHNLILIVAKLAVLLDGGKLLDGANNAENIRQPAATPGA